MATKNNSEIPRWSIPFMCAGIFVMGFLGGKIVYQDTSQPDETEAGMVLDEGPLFSRENRLPYLRSDAYRGVMELRKRDADEAVSASRIEWVALAVKDLPELAPLAEDFSDNLTVGALLPVYETAYKLADIEINGNETSPEAIATARNMLKENLATEKK